MRRLILILAGVIILSGCETIEKSSYPEDISSQINDSSFPPAASGYQRMQLLSYDATGKNHSIGYSRDDGVIQNVVTIYFYPKEFEIDDQLAGEIWQIQQFHVGLEVKEIKDIKLTHESNITAAKMATFTFDTIFSGKQQSVSSYLILISQPERYVKIRSTTPVGTENLVVPAMLNLVEIIGWNHAL